MRPVDPSSKTVASAGLVATVDRSLATVARIAVIAALVMVLVFTVMQVADRYVLKSRFDAHDQMARLGLVWLTFIGFAAGVRERVNIRIELLEHLLDGRWVVWLGRLFDVILFGTSVFLLVIGWRLLEIGGFQSIFGTPFTYSIVYAGLLAGLILLCMFLALRLIALWSGRNVAHEDRDT